MSASSIEQVRGSFNSLRGELFGLVDATGMWPGQADAWKRLIRSATYDCQRSMEAMAFRQEERENARQPSD